MNTRDLKTAFVILAGVGLGFGLAASSQAQTLTVDAGANPADTVLITNMTDGTSATGNVAMLPNCDAGDIVRITCMPDYVHTFLAWSGALPPGFVAGVNPQTWSANGLSYTFSVTYQPRPTTAYSITLNADAPVDGDVELWNQSANELISPRDTITYNYGLQGQSFRIRAIPAPTSVFVRWDGVPTNLVGAANPQYFTLSTNDYVYNLRAVFLSGTTDTDGDGLFDAWEYIWDLEWTNNRAENGANGNPDNDAVPDQGFGTAGGYYDIAIGSALWNNYGFSPNPQNPFTNIREQNGFDGVFSGIAGPRGDDPRTDPKEEDTDSDELPDGWEYYFWGSAVRQMTNGESTIGMRNDGSDAGAPIPTDDVLANFDPIVPGGPDDDVDNDGLSQAEELAMRTDPIHWDTDRDGMPDGYEARYGLNPRADDADSNPDFDYFAVTTIGTNTYYHHDVYQQLQFDPRTAWHPTYWTIWMFNPNPGYITNGSAATPNTRPFTSLEEYRAMVRYWQSPDHSAPVHNPGMWTNYMTHPLQQDSDGDGIHDGWELYVGLNPVPPGGRNDGPQEMDGDGLSNFQEFSCQQLANLFDAAWQNKIWPTDPNNSDTDGDQLLDGGEQTIFKTGGGAWNGNCFDRGGCNPTSVDTDGDHLPDAWEAKYQAANAVTTTNGMDATVQDDKLDYDGDGLLNYQEYVTASVHAWQYLEWMPGLALGSYDPSTFFKLQPWHWDWHYYADVLRDNGAWGRNANAFVPYLFVDGTPVSPTTVWFSSTDPTDWESSGSLMDDFNLIYHGLNPLFGAYDLYLSKLSGGFVIADPNDPTFLPLPWDIRRWPCLSGHPWMDPDQDGLPTSQESLQPNEPDPQYYHTDPSPTWITDLAYDRSFVNLYYQPGEMIAGNPGYIWFWSDPALFGANYPPNYMFSFETAEGFDTDTDGLGDRAEINDTAVSPGYTDPQDADSPRRRRALYLNGNAAARTFSTFYHTAYMLENFTIEAWVRPQNPTTGVRQVIVERPIEIPNGNVMGYPEGVRLNFRMGILGDGRPFVEYTGFGYDLLYTTEAPTTHKLQANRWYHIAGVYNAGTKQLMLYLNGTQVASQTYAERPANGWIIGNPGDAFFAPIVVGARDRAPSSIINGTMLLTGGPLQGAVFAQPELAEFFNGWIDEVRIWDGVCTPTQIATNKSRSLHLADVAASVTGRQTNPSNAVLLCLYAFDNMLDPVREGVVPQGFNLLNGRPNDGSYAGVPWWRTAADRSNVYNDYTYVPWIANLAARYPLNPPADSRLNTNDVNNVFPNTANPYNFGYITGLSMGQEQHPYMYTDTIVPYDQAPTALLNDLLPLRYARVDSSIAMWDGGAGEDSFDSNGDGIPDWWAQRYGFDPYGPSIAYLDSDNDGLSNLAEFNAGTNPRAYDTDGDGFSDYDSRPAVGGRTWGEIFTDNDGIDDAWEMQYPGILSPLRYDATADPDADGWSNLGEFLWKTTATNVAVNSTNPDDVNSHPDPQLGFAFLYDGLRPSGPIVVQCYTTNSMDGVPDGSISYVHANTLFPFVTPLSGTTNSTMTGYLREGPNWIFGFIDNNSNGEWDLGEPAGTVEGIPVNIGYGDVTGLTMRLTDQSLPGLPRIDWTMATNANVSTVKVVRTSTVNWPVVWQRVVAVRSYLHEGDFWAAGMVTLDPGASDAPTYNIYVNDTLVNSNLVVNWATPGTPMIHSPVGGMVFARNPFSWTASGPISQFQLEIRKNATNGAVVFNSAIPARYSEANGTYTIDSSLIPLFAGETNLPNGSYYFRVQAFNPRRAGAFSAWRNFIINLQDQPDNTFSIAGTTYYFGLASPSPVVVQAFKNYGFGGLLEAQVTLTNTGAFRLPGLISGTYYVRAFMDQNRNGRMEATEPRGFVKDYVYVGDYPPFGLNLPPSQTGLMLVLREQDANENRIPDGWEYMTVGNDDLANFDSNGDGITDGKAIDLGLDPWRLDTDGDRFIDALELLLGSSPLNAMSVSPVTHLLDVTGLTAGPVQNVVTYDLTPGVTMLGYAVKAVVEATPAAGTPFTELPGSVMIIPAGGPSGPFTYTHVHNNSEAMYFYRVRWQIVWP